MNIEQAISRLYANEINCRIYSDWDISFTVQIGDEMNGYEATEHEVKVEDIADALIKLAKQAYPSIVFDC